MVVVDTEVYLCLLWEIIISIVDMISWILLYLIHMLFLHYLEQLDKNRSQERSNCGKNIRDTLGWHLVLSPPPFFFCTTFWHLWSITELMNGNIGFLCLSDSSVLHCVSYTRLKTHVIRGMSVCAFWEQGIVFQSKDKVNSDNSLKLLNKHNDIFFWG